MPSRRLGGTRGVGGAHVALFVCAQYGKGHADIYEDVGCWVLIGFAMKMAGWLGRENNTAVVFLPHCKDRKLLKQFRAESLNK